MIYENTGRCSQLAIYIDKIIAIGANISSEKYIDKDLIYPLTFVP
jgi:hypothetical protein